MSRTWTRQPERGSKLLLRFMIWLTLTFGWRIGHLLLYPITTYFLIFSTSARAASRDFLTAALGCEATIADLFRHYFTFSSTILDRPFFLTGRIAEYEIEVSGLEALRMQIDSGRGCILLGSHLGSFEVLRAIADAHCPVAIKALMYEENAARANQLFGRLNPGRPTTVIPIGSPESMLRVKESLDAGELVGILADRTIGGDRAVEAIFLGRRVAFPAGPIILAGVLKAPVFLFYGIHVGARRYRIYFEHFSDSINLDRATRDTDVQSWVQRYAKRLEYYSLAYPYNWFNFYDFWGAQAKPAGRSFTADGRRRPVLPGLGARVFGSGPSDRRADGDLGTEEGEPRRLS